MKFSSANLLLVEIKKAKHLCALESQGEVTEYFVKFKPNSFMPRESRWSIFEKHFSNESEDLASF